MVHGYDVNAAKSEFGRVILPFGLSERPNFISVFKI